MPLVPRGSLSYCLLLTSHRPAFPRRQTDIRAVDSLLPPVEIVHVIPPVHNLPLLLRSSKHRAGFLEGLSLSVSAAAYNPSYLSDLPSRIPSPHRSPRLEPSTQVQVVAASVGVALSWVCLTHPPPIDHPPRQLPRRRMSVGGRLSRPARVRPSQDPPHISPSTGGRNRPWELPAKEMGQPTNQRLRAPPTISAALSPTVAASDSRLPR